MFCFRQEHQLDCILLNRCNIHLLTYHFLGKTGLNLMTAPDRVLELKQMALKLMYTMGSNYALRYG